ncbi:hypothetical protein ZX61_20120 [Vibrio sp. VPAP30]|nr:hypothetical protein ZX61_20120 [Vibrio sp. VPAP30]
MRDAGCGMRDAGCGMRDAGCGMRDAGCGMRDAGCGMRDAGLFYPAREQIPSTTFVESPTPPLAGRSPFPILEAQRSVRRSPFLNAKKP